jgi:hypothetical protein
MDTPKTVTAADDNAIWQQVSQDLEATSIPFQYAVNIRRNTQTIALMIEVDPGGGFEGSFETTTFTAPVAIQFTTLRSEIAEDEKHFRFALHDEGFIDKLGKFFGMEDIETGYPEFDKKIIVKANDKEKLKAIFSNATARKVFQSLESFRLEIVHYEKEAKNSSLELMIDRGITDPAALRKIYDGFVSVLDALDKPL